MKFQAKLSLLLFCIFSAIGCGNCEKLALTNEEKAWVNHFKVGQQSYYRNSHGMLDTLEVKSVVSYFTQCNKIELSNYQYEVYGVTFKFRSIQPYKIREPFITISTEEWKHHIPEIIFANLGPFLNNLQNKLPAPIDTIIRGMSLKSVYYYAKGLNTEQYGEKEYFKSFFWNKEVGLVAYTTIDDETYIKMD